MSQRARRARTDARVVDDKGLVTIDVGRSEVLIEGTSERARGVVVRGYSRNAVRRAFDATTVSDERREANESERKRSALRVIYTRQRD